MLGLVVGVSGTMAGGFFIIRYPNAVNTRQGWLLGFSGGIMLAVVLFDLWPEAWHFGGAVPTIVGTVIGMLLVQYFEGILRYFPWYQSRQFSKVTQVGILLGLGIGTHNFPEGVALGTTYSTGPALGNWLGLALLMALHNIPEGMVMASAFQLGKVRVSKILLSLILVEVPMALGSLTGAWLGQLSPYMVSVSLSFAGGAMILLVLKELMPLAHKLAGFFWVGTGFGVGCLAGIFLVRLI